MDDPLQYHQNGVDTVKFSCGETRRIPSRFGLYIRTLCLSGPLIVPTWSLL